ncbi:MAG: creatininase family protein [Synergistaceae bacterium]|nr:creatininase family protein [Synergistaceae bacterium]
MKLLEMNTLDFQEAMKNQDTVILPSGACEVWGPHLPLGADTIVAEEMANRLAEEMGWIVGPTLPVGDSLMVWGPGTVAVRPESFRNYLEDICLSLVKHGFKRFCFMNPHVGNVPLIAQTAAKMKMEYSVDSCLFDWWRFIEPLCDREGILDNRGAMAHGHASEAGTSVLLYLRPDLVKMERAVRTEPKKVNPFPDIGVFWPIPSLTDTLMIGDATGATREKGQKIVEKGLERMIAFLKQW